MYKALVGSLQAGDTIVLDSTGEAALVVSHRFVRIGRQERVEMRLRFPGEREETRDFHTDARFIWQP